MSKRTADVVVVGGGIAGSCAALRAVQYGLSTVWMLGDRRTAKASRSKYIPNLDNMAILSGCLIERVARARLEDSHPEAARVMQGCHTHVGTMDIIEDVQDRIRRDYPEWGTIVESAATNACREGEQFRVSTPDGEHRAPYLVLATGVMDRQPLLAGPRGAEPRPNWLYPYANKETILYCVRCEGHLTRDTHTAVIGSGETAAQVALMLRERYGTRVTLLPHQEDPSWTGKTARLLSACGVGTRAGVIREVFGDPKAGALHGFRFEDGSELCVAFALVAMGLHRVYNDLARGLGAELEESDAPEDRRHVLVDRESETNVANLFCVGDMTRGRDERIRKQVYTAQEYAVRAVDVIDTRVRALRRSRLAESG